MEAERKKISKKFICKGDPSIDCLRWYITDSGEHIPNPEHRYRIEGYVFGDCAMSMHMECARDEKEYMPDKIREVALNLLIPQTTNSSA